MDTFLCTIHNIHFGIDWATGERPDDFVFKCPMCMSKEISDSCRKLAEVIDHRDSMLRMIDLAKSVQKVTP